MKDEMNSIKQIVKEVMEADFRSRESDHWLIIEVLRRLGFKIYIDYKEITEMPSFETITRCRRLLQQENKELWSSPNVQDTREKRRKEMLDYLSPDSSGEVRRIVTSTAKQTVTVKG